MSSPILPPASRGVLPLVVAHRGASADKTENTVEAYREAVAQQADWIELDVHLLADGALGVYHDNALPTGELMADLRAEDLPAHFPLLGAALDASEGCVVNIEIKAEGPAAERDAVDGVIGRIVELLAAREASREPALRYVISSFHLDLLAEMRSALDSADLARVPTAALGWGFSDMQVFIDKAVAARCAFLHPWHPETTADVVTAAHDAGLGVNVWTANHPDLIRQLADMGVDGIITDEPANCRSVLIEWARQSKA